MLSSLKLSSKTIIGKQQNKKVKNLLQSLITNNDSLQFRAPVDWKNLGILDYPILIKYPMDLGTITNKFNQQKYLYIEQVLDDIQLIWDNCKLYNPTNSWIYNIAQKLQRSFKKMVKNYLPNISIIIPGRNNSNNNINNNNILTKQDKKTSLISLTGGQDDQINNNNIEVPYNEKLKISQKLKLLKPQDLGIIVQYIIQKCPSAFKQIGQQNAQLILDNLDIKLIKQIKIMIDDIINGINGQDKVIKRLKLD